MMIPSLLLTLGVAVALGGWTVVPDRGPRRVAIGIAVVSLLVLAWRAPHVVRDFRTLNGQMTFVEAQQNGLSHAPRRAARRPGAAVVPPDHRAVALGDPGHPLRDGAAEGRLPGDDRAGAPAVAGRATSSARPSTSSRASPARRSGVAHGRTSARRPWSTRHVRGFTLLARNKRWAAYARGC